MDLLDGIIIAALVVATVHGARRGAAVQLVTFAGFLAGLALGVALVLAIAPHVHGQTAKTITAAALLVVPAAVLAGVGRRVGSLASERLRRWRAGWLDSALGSLVAVLGTLVACWLFASVLVDSSIGAIADQIDGSVIVRSVATALPPVPDEFAAVQRYLSSSGFPEVLVNALPEPVGPVRLPTAEQVRSTAAGAEASTVKILALGCGNIQQEGSGFVVAPGLVVTNAHVVAGTDQIEVVEGSSSVAATPVLFDPVLDLAVLRTMPLGLPALRLDPSFVERATPAVVLGYPDDGPLKIGPAGVQSRYVAEGRDIYATAISVRTVYALKAVIRPGNSGGPLLSTSGEVIGIVFSRSATNPDVGYALASPAVRRLVATVSAASPPVGTEGCISGS